MLSVSHPPSISLSDTKITQREAARLLGVSFPTASRYMTRGRLGVRLPSAKIGGKRLTTAAAVEWFFEALQHAEQDAVENAASNEVHNTEERGHAHIEAEADAEGL